MSRKWKLGQDLHPSDNIQDPITFDSLILWLRNTNEPLTKELVRRSFRELVQKQYEDTHHVLNNNLQEILYLAAQGRDVWYEGKPEADSGQEA